MKYKCTQCDITFELEESKKKIRCPECMGIHDVEPVQEEEAPPLHKRPSFVPILILVAVAGAVVWWFVNNQSADPEYVEPSVDLTSLLEEAGLVGDQAIDPIETTDAVKAFAEKASEGADGAAAVKAIHDALVAGQNSKWKPFAQNIPRADAPLTANEMAQKLSEDELYVATSYEITALLLSAARAVGVENAQMAEVFSFDGEKRPADPSMVYGRFAVALVGDGDPVLYDAWGGRSDANAKADIALLSPAETAAVYYSHRSIAHIAVLDGQAALKDSDVAVQLAPDNATMKTHRGRIFMEIGRPDEGLAEFEKAQKAKDWAGTRVVLAQLKLGSPGEANGVEEEIVQTLKEFPEYYQARVLLALLNLSRGDKVTAKRELDLADRHAPASPEVAHGMAQYYMADQDTENAIRMAKKTVRLSGNNLPSLLLLAQIYGMTARFDEMRDTALEALGKATSPEMKSRIRQQFRLEDDLVADGDDVANVENDSDGADDLGDMELKLDNSGSTLGGGKLKLGGGNLKLDMNSQ